VQKAWGTRVLIMLTIEDALRAMGYTKCEPNKWLKPVGFQVFSFDEETLVWTNWFKSMQGEVMRMDAKEMRRDFADAGDPLSQIKHFECWTRTDVYVKGDSKFEMDPSVL